MLPPALAEVYCANIKALAISLDDEDTKSEAIELLRGLITEVLLHPDEDATDGHVIELYGELAAFWSCQAPETTNPAVLRAGCRFRWLRE